MKNTSEEILKRIVDPLLQWYGENKRKLPWRKDPSAYHVWISEIMLQQTRVSTVIPYYQRFMQEYPTVEELARADDETLLRVWQGLGYYSRAKNLKRAAIAICNDFSGALPQERDELITLPGVGDYTAGAISSIAFKKVVPAVDGNVLRVVARLINFQENILNEKSKKLIRELVKDTMSKDQPGDYNQAMMDLGAGICVPNTKPYCEKCPLADYCLAHQQHKEEKLPVRIKKLEKREEEMTVFLLLSEGKVAIKKRENDGLLGNLWEYPNVPGKLDEIQTAQQIEKWGMQIKNLYKSINKTHIFTHVKWKMRGYVVEIDKMNTDRFTWCSSDERNSHAIPSAFSKFTKEYENLL